MSAPPHGPHAARTDDGPVRLRVVIIGGGFADPAAVQMGRHAAATIARDPAGRPRRPFRYRDKGTLATIGRYRAVADFGRFRFTGSPAWLRWLFVHILYLVGFRNRVAVLVNWACAYLTFERGVRLIHTTSPQSASPANQNGPRPERP